MGHALYIVPLLLAITYTLWAWWLVDVQDVPGADHG
jgi:hypothetical protein